jgi:competence protein ComEC
VTAAAGPDRWRWLDLRLVPVAGTVWGATLGATWLSAPVLTGVAVGAALLAVLPARRRTPVAGVVAAALLALAVTGACSALRAAAREGSPLHDPSVAGRVVVTVLRVDGDPRPVTGSAGPPRVVVDATAVRLELTDRTVVLRDAVVVFGTADDWSGVLPGEQVRVRAAVRAAPAVDGAVALLSARAPPDRLAGPGWVQRTAGGVRDHLAAAARGELGDEVGGLLPGLALGDTRALDPLLEADFRAAGLTHLVAVSGANVAIVLAGVLWPLRRRAVDRRVQALVAVLALAALVVLVRPGPSVLRAAAMGVVGIAGLAAGRPRAAVPALSAAVTVLMLARPTLAEDAGFSLSVAATAGIVLLAPRWSAALRRHRCPGLLADALAVSAAAGLVTAPVIAGISGRLPLVSLPANLLAAPAVAPATVLGLVAALLAPWAPGPAGAVLWVAGWPVRWLVVVARRAAALPDTTAPWPAGWRGALLLGLLVLAAGVALWRWERLRWLALAALVALVAVGWPVRQVVRSWPPATADLVACDVGQGDALVVPTAPGQAVLVDVGPDPVLEDACLRRLGITDVPLVLLSHLDADHVTGLPGALAGRAVGVVATAVLAPSDDRVGRVDRLAREAGATRATLLPGYRRTVGTATLEVLAPPERSATATAQPNDLCMLVRLTQRGLRVLLTGDLNAEAERRILDRGVDLRADVLKVPHHGSADADPDFLAATGARVALVSVGAANRYGHPAQGTLDDLARDGMQVHRTDREGDLAVVGPAGDWGVAARGGPGPTAAPDRRGGGPPATVVTAAAPGLERRRSVAACCRARRSPRPDVTPARRRGGGGAAARQGGLRRPRRRPRAPPRRGGARTGRRRPADRSAGRRAGALPVRWPPAGRGARGAGGRRRARRRAHRLHARPRSRSDAGDRALRRQAQRGAGQGLHRRRCGAGRVPEAQVRR